RRRLVASRISQRAHPDHLAPPPRRSVSDLRQRDRRADLSVGRHRPSLLRIHPQPRLSGDHGALRRDGGDDALRESRRRRALRVRRSAHSPRRSAMKTTARFTPVWRRFRRSRLALAALVYIAIVSLIALCAPIVAPLAPNDTDLAARLQPPNAAHHLGTDELGRDILSRMIHG